MSKVPDPAGKMEIQIKYNTEEGVGPLDRRMDLWVSDDSRRLPVKVQIDLPVGSFVLLLKQVS